MRGVIFDLDGTLLDTIKSIELCGNKALKEYGYEPISREKYCYLAGDGAKELVRRMLRERGDEDLKDLDKVYEKYLEFFQTDCFYEVAPYEGIPELLEKLKEAGMKMAVLSNKPHKRTVEVIEKFFGKGYFDWVQGQKDGVPKKPSPEGALAIAQRWGTDSKDCLYVGDTDTDMKTGKSAGMYTVGVLWGFRNRKELEENGADAIIEKPKELYSYFL